MKKRMYELAKTRRGLKKKKAHKRSVYGLSGVPGATRTPGLPLRRTNHSSLHGPSGALGCAKFLDLPRFLPDDVILP